MPTEAPEPPPSITASLARLGRAVLVTLSNRAELLLVELQEERHRLLQALVLVACIVITSSLALVLVTFTVVILFWEQRVITLIVLSLLYIAASVIGFLQLRRQLRDWQAFSGTMSELKKDRECLR